MENIGLYLKKLREESSLSINEISEKSKIKNYLLERLEKNDFKSIGEVGYARIVLLIMMLSSIQILPEGLFCCPKIFFRLLALS